MGFLTTISLISLLCILYLLFRLILPLTMGKGLKFGAFVFVSGIFAVLPLRVIALNSGISSLYTDPLVKAGFIGLGFISFLMVFLIARDLLTVVFRIVVRIRRRGKGVAEPNYERRRFLQNTTGMALTAAAVGCTYTGVKEAAAGPVVERVTVSLESLPKEFDGFKIVQITDLHVSAVIKKEYVEHVVAEVNKQNADIVAVTGDIIDGSVKGLQADVAPLGRMKGKYGTFFVTGNHEYYSGVHQWVEHFKSLGMNVLMNEHVVLRRKGQELAIAGVTDVQAGRRVPDHTSDPFKAVDGLSKDTATVLLAHQPRSAFMAAEAGVDLQISGHTHGGQFFPWNYVVHLAQPFVSGLYKHKGMQIYVNRGTGYWGPPLRNGVPSEITVFTLKTCEKKPRHEVTDEVVNGVED